MRFRWGFSGFHFTVMNRAAVRTFTHITCAQVPESAEGTYLSQAAVPQGIRALRPAPPKLLGQSPRPPPASLSSRCPSPVADTGRFTFRPLGGLETGAPCGFNLHFLITAKDDCILMMLQCCLRLLICGMPVPSLCPYFYCVVFLFFL